MIGEIEPEHRMLHELVTRFVADELMPLETAVLAREVAGTGPHLTAEEQAAVDARSRELGLWGLDAPADLGGHDLPAVAMIGVNEALGRTIVPYTLPPDSPNLRMLAATVTERQREAYVAPYVRGETVSAIAISEPGAGSDPAGMTTRAVRDGDSGPAAAAGDWVINGRKIWITRAADADFAIVMAVTDAEKRARGGMSAFLVDRAWQVVDHAMQALGAMGMTRELPLHLMAAKLRTMRIYDGPTEVHQWVVARDVLGR